MVFSLLSLVVLVPHAVEAAATEEDVANTSNSSTAPITWDSFPPFTVDQITELKFNITDPQDIPNLRILLIQINGEPGDTISTVNTVLEQELQLCKPPMSTCIPENDVMTGKIDLEFSGADLNIAELQNLFFCIASNDDPMTCEQGSISQVFNIAPDTNSALANNDIVTVFVTPTDAVSVTASNTVSAVSMVVIPSKSGSPTILSTSSAGIPTSSTTTTSVPPTNVTMTPTSAATSAASPKGSPNQHGLSKGAKAGIAVGAIVLATILLIIAFLLIRRQKLRKMQPEHMMLAHGSNHSREGSRDMIAEKGALVAAGTETTRSVANGDIADEEPRREQSPVREQTREAFSSPETMSPATREQPFEERYSDTPAVYGDARHSPQIFRGSQHFLGEEGMSPEEIARLEEEERRIDLAIAEAERRQ